jgi:hypothetical protein
MVFEIANENKHTAQFKDIEKGTMFRKKIGSQQLYMKTEPIEYIDSTWRLVTTNAVELTWGDYFYIGDEEEIEYYKGKVGIDNSCFEYFVNEKI